MLRWQSSIFKNPVSTAYDKIADITTPEFEWLDRRRNKTTQQKLQADKFRFKQTFNVNHESVSELWALFNEHKGLIAHTLIERFESFDDVVTKRFGLLWQTQRSSEWLDMTAAKLITIRKLTAKLGLTELWNSNGAIVSPNNYRLAVSFVDKNKEQIQLAFMRADTVKAILLHWGGHKLRIANRVRNRVNGTRIDASIRKLESPMWNLLRHPHNTHHK